MRLFLSLLVGLLLAANSQALVLYNNAVPPSTPPSGVMGLYAGWMGCVVINPNWIIVCNHEGGGPGTTVVVNGTTYVVATMYYSGSYDMNLARITKPDGSNANLPDYADLSLDNSSLVGKQVVIGGFGYTRGSLTANGGGYNWSGVGAGVLQWGTNTVTYNMYNYLYDSFDPAGSSKATPYEAGMAEGDSGGGWFYLNATTHRWMVAGLNDGVTTAGACMFSPADTDDAVGVPAMASWINSIIATQGAPKTYTVTVNQTTGGTAAISPNQATYPSGANATVTATPAAGHLFAGWNVSGGTISGNTGTDTLTINGNVTLSANFAAATYTVTVNQKAGGTVSLSPNQTTYLCGATATVTATPAAGSKFAGWSVTGGTVSGNTGTDTLTINGNVTLSANFTAETFTVTAETSTTWVYQNTPVVTLDRHVLTLAVDVTNDTWNNRNYTVTVTQTGPGVVTPTQAWTCGTTVAPALTAAWTVPAGGSLSGYLVGGRVNGTVIGSANTGALTGDCSVKVTVVGDVSGPQNPATATVALVVRPLGDINGDGAASVTDKGLLNMKLNGNTSSSVTSLDPEVWNLDGSEVIAPKQKSLLNGVLNGNVIQ